MGRGIRVLVLLACLGIGLVLVLHREAVYEATASAQAIDGPAAARVEQRARADGFAGEVAAALAADPPSALPALTVTREGSRVLVSARDVDPLRAEDTVDTAVHLLSAGATADAVDRTTSSAVPEQPVNASSLVVLGVAAAVLAAVGAVTAWLLARRRRSR